MAQIVGSSPYISPEELKGARGDARGDVYALGVILYEMVTGTLPFPGPDLFDRLTVNPVPPREIESFISPQLQEVIYRAMEKEHKNRYANAHDMAADLTHLERVHVVRRPELPCLSSRRVYLYSAIALIPIVIFGLLLYFSHH